MEQDIKKRNDDERCHEPAENERTAERAGMPINGEKAIYAPGSCHGVRAGTEKHPDRVRKTKKEYPADGILPWLPALILQGKPGSPDCMDLRCVKNRQG